MNRIYVVNYASSDVTVIDGVSNRPIATVNVGWWPWHRCWVSRFTTDAQMNSDCSHSTSVLH